MSLAMIAAAGIPVLSDLIVRLADKFIGKDSSPETLIRLAELDVEKLNALSKLDSVGETYKWVNSVRALQRPVYGGIILLAWVVLGLSLSYGLGDITVYIIVSELAGSVIFYLFGERTMMHLRRGK